MKNFIVIILSIMFLIFSCITTDSDQSIDEWKWEITNILPSGRFDAIAYFGDGVVVVGSRFPNPGKIFRSTDFGRTWDLMDSILPAEDFITCIASDEKGNGYILTGKYVHVWKSEDFGKSWRNLGQVSNAQNSEGFANAYSILVTDNGTILVADANSSGGNIIRSVDESESWEKIPSVSEKALYRLNKVGDGIIVNGWKGNIYKSIDDGLTWKDMGKIADSYLYAIENMDTSFVLIGTESGEIFRSTDNAITWENMGVQFDAADDFVYFGKGRVLFTTYREQKKIYLSEDYGESWKSIGNTNTEEADWLDHVISVKNDSLNIIIGVTNKGYILRKEVNP